MAESKSDNQAEQLIRMFNSWNDVKNIFPTVLTCLNKRIKLRPDIS